MTDPNETPAKSPTALRWLAFPLVIIGGLHLRTLGGGDEIAWTILVLMSAGELHRYQRLRSARRS